MDLKADRSERVQYNKTGLPIYLKKGTLSLYPNYSAESHWHDDIEFITITSGKMSYSVNGNIIRLTEGNGLFVNTRQFHYGFSEDFSECKFNCAILHPVLLSASQYIDENFVLPILKDETLPYYVFSAKSDWEKSIIDRIDKMFTSNEMETVALFYEIWNELYKNRCGISKVSRVGGVKLNALKNMVSFIQSSFAEKITLSDIAKAGLVGKTECCAIFKTYANMTPIAYLNDFRLRKSIDLLTQTDLSVSKICAETGFFSASYFAESFKRTFLCTPKEYRIRFSRDKIVF